MKVSDPSLSDGNLLYFLISSLGEWFLEPPPPPLATSPFLYLYFTRRKEKIASLQNNFSILIVSQVLNRGPKVDPHA